MPFPFTIKYSLAINKDVSSFDASKTLDYIEGIVTEKAGEVVARDILSLTFKSPFFSVRRNNFNLLVPVEKGVFTIVKEDKGLRVDYRFSMYRILIGVAVLSTAIWLISHDSKFALLSFAWLGGGNWLLAVIRHYFWLKDIRAHIKEMT